MNTLWGLDRYELLEYLKQSSYFGYKLYIHNKVYYGVIIYPNVCHTDLTNIQGLVT